MKFSTAVIGLALIAPSIVLAQKVDMKLNLEKGKTYTQKTEVVNMIKQNISGQEMEMNNSQMMTTNVELSEDNGSTDLYKIWSENIAISGSAMGQTQTFNSDTSSLENVDVTSKVLAGLVDKKFDAKITEKGMVEEVMGLDELIAAASDGIPGAQPTIELIKSSIGIDGLAKNLEMTTDIFPEKKVKPGDTWEKSQFTSTGLPIIANTVYTLKEVKDGMATIEVNSTLETNPENSSTQMQGMEATQFYEGSRKGMLTVELATGWVSSGTFEDDIVGSISFAPNAQIPDGMTVPIEMTNNITISN